MKKKEVESKFKNLSADQKKLVNDMVVKLQRERGRARNAEMALAEAKRENLKITQEREEEKLFLASKLRSAMEAEKKRPYSKPNKKLRKKKNAWKNPSERNLLKRSTP